MEFGDSETARWIALPGCCGGLGGHLPFLCLLIEGDSLRPGTGGALGSYLLAFCKVV